MPSIRTPQASRSAIATSSEASAGSLPAVGLLVETVPLWLAETNCYVVASDRGGPAAIIDTPPDAAGIAQVLARIDCYPAALLITHGHIDHVGGAGAIAADAEVLTYIHPDDDFLSLDPATQLEMLFGTTEVPGDFQPPSSRSDLADGQVLDVAGLRIDVVHTPGHTPGHCCFHLAAEGLLFSGDQLFAGSIGRTDLPGGDFDELMRSMRDKVLALPDETRVLPGHGPATTLAIERRANPFLRALA